MTAASATLFRQFPSEPVLTWPEGVSAAPARRSARLNGQDVLAAAPAR
jgi:hypothetical protein